MRTVRDALEQRPSSELYSISPDQTVFSAAQYMTAKNIGAVVVVENDELLGVISERDIMGRVVSHELDPHKVSVRAVMSTNLVVASPDESCAECGERMREAGCRHLPIVDEGKLIGMISLRDILRTDLQEKVEQVELLDHYVWHYPSKSEDRT